MDEEQERVSKMTMEEFVAAEERWARIAVPNKQELESIKDYANYLNAEVAQLAEAQPKCSTLKENYDKAFSEYKARVEEVSHSNRKALKIMDDFCHLANVQNEIETLRELCAKNREFCNDSQKDYFMKILGYLVHLKIGFEMLSNVKLEGQDELKKGLENNASVLGQLGLSTHKWIPIEKRTLTFKPEWNPPEGSSMEPRKAEVHEFVTKSKCEYCSTERSD